MHAVRQRGTSLRGAFARVGPTTDEALLHRQRAVVSLYRSLLKLSSLFFDDVGSEYLQWRTREMFRRRQFERSHKCVNAYVKEARVARRRVQRAIDGDAKTITHILELAYGKRGRLKHVFQAHFNEVQAGPKRHRALTPPRTSTNTGARWPHNLRGYRQPLPPKITRLLELRSADVAYNRRHAGLPAFPVPMTVPVPEEAVPREIAAFIRARIETAPRAIRRRYAGFIGFSPTAVALVDDIDVAGMDDGDDAGDDVSGSDWRRLT